MSIVAAELIARVSAAGVDATAAQLAGVGKSADAARARFAGLAALSAGVLVAAFVAIGVKAVEMAGNFERATNTLITSAGLSRDSIDAVRQGILQMSIDTATSTDQLTKGMFNVQSALHLGAGGLLVLKAAAEGAKAENSDLAATTDVLTTAMVNYHLGAAAAVPTMNSLIVTIAAGKMHMNDLTGALKNVLPVAAAFHVHLSDVEGALASMANAGDRGTIAGTHLAMMFKMLSSPVGAAKKEMAAMGLDSIKLAQTMQTSLPGALKMIQDAVTAHFKPGSVEYNRAILAILGGSKSGVAGLEIFNQGLKTLGQNTGDAASALRKGSKDVENWSVIQGGFNFKLDQAKAAGEKFMIVLGEKLLPVFGKIVDAITPLVNKLADFASTLTSSSPILAALGGILAGLAVVIIAAVVPSILAAATAFGALTIAGAPVWIVMLAVIAAVTAIILVIQHWGQISTWIGGVMSVLGTKVHEIVGNIGGAFSALGSKVQSVLSGIGSFFSGLGTKIHDVLSGIGSFVGSTFSKLGSLVHDALLAAASFVINKFNDILTFIKSIPGKITAALATLGAILLAPFKWLYDHNYYVKAAVDSAINFFNQLKTQVGAIFSAIGTFIRDRLTWINNSFGWFFSQVGTHTRDFLTMVKNAFGTAFQWLGTFIHDRLVWINNSFGWFFSQVGTHLHDFFSMVTSFVGQKMSALGTMMHSGLNVVLQIFGTAFSQLGTLVHGKLTDLWNWIKGFLAGWPAFLFNAGVALIEGLIGGIAARLGALKDMMGNVAGAIGNFLGFHKGSLIPPKEGPAKDADQWMPALMGGLIGDIQEGTPGVHAALGKVMAPLAASARASLSLSAIGNVSGGFTSAGLLSGSVARTSIAGGGATHNITINVQPPDTVLDGVRVSRQLLPHFHRAILYNTGHIGP